MAMCSVFRFAGLSVEEVLVLNGWLLAAQHIPSLVMTLRPDQQSISQQRIAHMSLLAFRCDLTPSTLVRALGTSLHGTHRIELFEQQKTMLCQILTATHYEHLERAALAKRARKRKIIASMPALKRSPHHHHYVQQRNKRERHYPLPPTQRQSIVYEG